MSKITGRAATSSVAGYIALAAFAALFAFAVPHAARAQWATSGSNISNTNTGNVGVGTATPGEKLVNTGNAIFGGPSARTELWPNFTATVNPALFELNSGAAVSNDTRFPALSLVTNQSGVSNVVGALYFSNSAQAGSDKRVAAFGVHTDGALNSGLISIGTAAGGTLAERMRITSAGHVGIGTANPVVNANAPRFMTVDGGGAGYAEFSLGRSLGATDAIGGVNFYNSALGSADKRVSAIWGGTGATTNSGVLTFHTWNAGTVGEVMRMTGAGSVGIGTATPGAAYKLDVNGAANVTGALNVAGTITGGNITAKYAGRGRVGPHHAETRGRHGRRLRPGALEPRPRLGLFVRHQCGRRGLGAARPPPRRGGEGKVMVATTGRVRVRVDATRAPVRIGDLLVTSDMPGVAMKSEPIIVGGRRIHAPGTIIGKALEPLAGGTGEILVLLSMQ
ncbi:MAG TPA: hypothetical protein VIP46_05945 [Pyrinomonadaceae bacterium]